MLVFTKVPLLLRCFTRSYCYNCYYCYYCYYCSRKYLPRKTAVDLTRIGVVREYPLRPIRLGFRNKGHKNTFNIFNDIKKEEHAGLKST